MSVGHVVVGIFLFDTDAQKVSAQEPVNVDVRRRQCMESFIIDSQHHWIQKPDSNKNEVCSVLLIIIAATVSSLDQENSSTRQSWSGISSFKTFWFAATAQIIFVCMDNKGSAKNRYGTSKGKGISNQVDLGDSFLVGKDIA